VITLPTTHHHKKDTASLHHTSMPQDQLGEVRCGAQACICKPTTTSVFAALLPFSTTSLQWHTANARDIVLEVHDPLIEKGDVGGNTHPVQSWTVYIKGAMDAKVHDVVTLRHTPRSGGEASMMILERAAAPRAGRAFQGEPCLFYTRPRTAHLANSTCEILDSALCACT
jgi:hypothetical protein